MKWSYIRSLADSKIVRSSYIWLFIVPIVARVLSTLDDVIDLTVLGETIRLSATLPFSWQALFFAASFFTVANIVYSIFCPEIFKTYRSYREFHEDGKTLLQVHSEMRRMTWSNKKPGVKKKYIKYLSSYFKHYCKQEKMDEGALDIKGRELFDDISQGAYANVTSNAFYFAYKVANEYNQPAIWVSLTSYIVGLFFFSVIAVQNIIYVVQTYG